MYKEEGEQKEAEPKSDSGYPASINTEAAVVVNEDQKLSFQNCCCGFSTEVDQLAKSKKNALAIEG